MRPAPNPGEGAALPFPRGPAAGVPELVVDVPARALAVYAHPDDADVSCGGTLACWAARGCEVRLLVCTKGDKGSKLASTDVEELVERRAAEVASAASVLGVSRVHRLERDDGELENDPPLRRAIVELVRSARPEVVICPDPTAVFFGDHYFNHRDHRCVGWATLDALFPAVSSPLYFPDAGPPWRVDAVYLSGSLEANVVVDVSSAIERKAEALRCHASQVGDGSEWYGAAVRERAEEAGRPVGLAFAEAFRRVRGVT